MYSYKFADDMAEFPRETHVGKEVMEGFTAFEDGESVDWTKRKRVNGVLEDIPKQPEPEQYVQTEAEIKQQKLQQLDWEYQQQNLELARTWAIASMDNNTQLMSDLSADRKVLIAEYDKKRGELDG